MSEFSSGFQYRRMPAVARLISDINPETDVRVRLVGRILGIDEHTIMLDDGSGTAEIIYEANEVAAEPGDTVRLFCRVLPLETSFELRLELIQDMSKLDLGMYRKICQKSINVV